MGKPRKKQPEPSNPSSNPYQGKPLLILLENYVLDCIGCLPEEKGTRLANVVQHIYGGGHDWKSTLRSVLQLDASLDEDLRVMWARNQEIAEQANVALNPEDFAQMIVEKNFAHLLD